MFTPNFIILYVENPEKSAAFYTELLGQPPVESSPNFAMFAPTGGVMFGLWGRHDVEPRALAAGGGTELGFTLESRAAVTARHADWSGRGLTIAQAPCELDFGFTFVALDPDGHRLRVFAPKAA